MDRSVAMQQAIACARLVEGRTAPRPPVGAVVVRDGAIVGRGYTSPPYGPHAEVHALQEAGEMARGADLYVTLEPCSIIIHTPACTGAIIAAGIRRVFIGSIDPNPLVNGRGLAQLQEAGIEVKTGIESQETDEIILPFATFMRKGRPYVTAKWGMTLDGKLATRTGDAYWITRSEARVWVHNLRDRVDAILVGAGTVRLDDPLLTVRLNEEQRTYQRIPRQGPRRVVLSSQGHLPLDCKLLQPELACGTAIIVGENYARDELQSVLDTGAEVLTVPLDGQGRPDLSAALRLLAQQGMIHILIEGGSQLLGSAFDQGLIDHVAAFIAPKLVGGTSASSPIGGLGIARMGNAVQLHHLKTQQMGEDTLIEGEVIAG